MERAGEEGAADVQLPRKNTFFSVKNSAFLRLVVKHVYFAKIALFSDVSLETTNIVYAFSMKSKFFGKFCARSFQRHTILVPSPRKTR